MAKSSSSSTVYSLPAHTRHVQFKASAATSFATGIAHLSSLFSFAVFFGLMCFGIYLSHAERKQFEAYTLANSEVKVLAPRTRPEPTQENVDAAIEIYNIEVPQFVTGPVFDDGLDDRGLTTGGTVAKEKHVFIGPAAFTSWGILGSTLGHEIEVHANQSFLKVSLLDRLGQASLSAQKLIGKFVPAARPSAKRLFEDEGTWRAEREAYLYEVRNARRFRLTSSELRSILQVMNFYYPEKETTQPLNADAQEESSEVKIAHQR